MSNKRSWFRTYSVPALALVASLAFAVPIAYAGKGGTHGGGGGCKHNCGGGGGGGGTPSYTLAGTKSGSAFGVAAEVDILKLLSTVHLTIPPTPYVVQDPAQAGIWTETLLTISSPGVLLSETMDELTAGFIAKLKAGSVSVSTLEHIDLLSSLLTADLVASSCYSWADGNGIHSAGDTLLVGIGGNSRLLGVSVQPDPNTVIKIASLGTTLVFNEQIPSTVTRPDGSTHDAITVNAIHATVFKGGLLGTLLGLIANADIVVSSAHCDLDLTTTTDNGCTVNCTPGGEGKITGGGWIRTPSGSWGNFGLNASVDAAHLQYVEHGKDGINVHATGLSSFEVNPSAVPGQGCAVFSGPARVDGGDGYTYEVEACDNGEPGTDDTFSIDVMNSSGMSIYSASDSLDNGRGNGKSAGNIQLHD